MGPTHLAKLSARKLLQKFNCSTIYMYGRRFVRRLLGIFFWSRLALLECEMALCVEDLALRR